jgi:hypothetical protein
LFRLAARRKWLRLIHPKLRYTNAAGLSREKFRRHPVRPLINYVFINIFEDARSPFERFWRRPKPLVSAMDYVDFVFRTRECTRRSQDEMVFVLYHSSGALAPARASATWRWPGSSITSFCITT